MDDMFREAEQLRLLAWTFTITMPPSPRRDKAEALYNALSDWMDKHKAP